MRPTMGLEQEVAQAKWPRTGKLLSRQTGKVKSFYTVLGGNVTGYYVNLLIAWFYDKVGENTKRLSNPMLVAREDLITRLEEADEKISAKVSKPSGLHALQCVARDRLTGREGILPLTVFTWYENAVVASLSAYGISRQQLREAFKEADRRISITNGYKVSANLEASIEARLKEFASQQGNRKEAGVKPYLVRDGVTPPRLDYFVNDRIEHPVWGLGTVVASGAVEAKKLLEHSPNSRTYPELQYSIDVRFDHKPEGAFKPVGPNTVRLTVKPAGA